jgi:hypothetical protein
VAENEDLSGKLQPRFSSAVTVQADAILPPFSGKQQGSPRHGGGPVQLGAGRGWLANQRREDAAVGLGAWPKPSVFARDFSFSLPFALPRLSLPPSPTKVSHYPPSLLFIPYRLEVFNVCSLPSFLQPFVHLFLRSRISSHSFGDFRASIIAANSHRKRVRDSTQNLSLQQYPELPVNSLSLSSEQT